MTTPRSTIDPNLEAEYRAKGWWGDDCLTDVIRRHAADNPNGTAFVDETGDRMSWRVYDELSDRIAAALLSTDLQQTERIIVFMPDGPLVHAAFVGAEKAGVVVMGIGHRAGESELAANPRSRSAVLRVAEKLDGQGRRAA